MTYQPKMEVHRLKVCKESRQLSIHLLLVHNASIILREQLIWASDYICEGCRVQITAKACKLKMNILHLITTNYQQGKH